MKFEESIAGNIPTDAHRNGLRGTSSSKVIDDLVYRTRPEDTTAGLSSSKSCGDYIPPRGEVGWICPICGRGLAPSTSYCPCNLTRNITYLNGGVSIQDYVNTNTTPPEACYTETATTVTSKCNGGIYGAHYDMHN